MYKTKFKKGISKNFQFKKDFKTTKKTLTTCDSQHLEYSKLSA